MADGNGAVAQLGEHLLCKQGVVGSIPSSSTIAAVAVARPPAVAGQGAGGKVQGLCERTEASGGALFASGFLNQKLSVVL